MDLAPRSQEGKAFPWEKLPQDLNFRVIDLATCNRWLRGGGQSSLANFSRVSKSWEALIKAYPASIVCKAKQLQAACRIFSGMTSVKILIEEETTLDLSHLKSCSKLLCVGLDNRGKYPEDGIWLNDLPESVTKLELLRLDIDSSFLESASHLKTTELSIICPTMESYMSYLPEYMPFLKRLYLAGMYLEEVAQDAFESLARLSELTTVIISKSVYEHAVQQVQISTALQRLTLSEIGCSTAWVDSFFTQLVGLTALEIGYMEPHNHHYFTPGLDEVEWQLALERRKAFCRLPNPSLPPLQHLREVSLEIGSGTYEKHLHAAEIQYLAKLPALIKLELKGAQFWPDLKALREMPVQQLRLYDCNPMEVDISVPGALTALTELRIVSSKVMQPKEPVVVHHRQTTCEAAVALKEVCTNILQLPRLQKLVVIGPLFRLGVQDKVEGQFACYDRRLYRHEVDVLVSEAKNHQFESTSYRSRNASLSSKSAQADV